MKLLTDSYYKKACGTVTLSGKSIGAEGIAAKRIESVFGGEKTVVFSPVNEEARDLIKREFSADFSESEEAYIITADENGVTVYANTERARIYAAYSLCARLDGNATECFTVYSTPRATHRSIRVFLPPKAELEFFYSYLDTLVELGYNAILLEIGGAMEFKSHPEINATWKEYCDSMKEYNEKVYQAQECYKRVKNSIHTFNADGDIYTQEELRELVLKCRERCIEIIPEVPSLSHSEYILISHPEMRECDDEDYASTACPQNEDFYKLVFELFDEVIEVFKPTTMHIGHDEWWVMCICDKCRGKDAAELFAYNVNRLYDYLKERGIKTMMWADKLKAVQDKTGECHGAARKEIYSLPTDKKVTVMGKEYTFNEMHWYKPSKEAVERGFLHVIHNTEKAIDLIPNDIICANWYHTIDPEINDLFLRKGFPMFYGNCRPSCLGNINSRFAYGAMGMSISSWTVTRMHDLQLWQQGVFFQVGFGAVAMWDADFCEFNYAEDAQRVRRQLYLRHNAKTLSAPHITVRHRVEEKIPSLEGYYTGRLPYCDDDALTLGEYVIKYNDGKEERHPVIYSINASFGDVKTGRIDGSVAWAYATDGRTDSVIPAALPVMEEDGFVYECVFPVRNGEFECRYEPREEHKDALRVISIKTV